MKKYLFIVFAIMISTLSTYAERGFVAKVYNENNVHFMTVILDFDYNKIKVQTNNPDIDYVIISRISNIDKTILYIHTIPTYLYNNGNYDENKTETFVFDTRNSLFSTYSSTRKLRFETYKLERNL